MRAMPTSKFCIALPVAVALLVGGCGGEDEPAAGSAHSASSSGTTGAAQAEPSFNSADIDFAKGMIPHHVQAVEMADMASEKAINPKVKELAAQIMTAQGPEIETLSGLLSSWGEPVPSSEDSESMDGMDHEAAGHSGMMMSEQMDELEAADGAEFERLWVDMMVEHHEGAVAMSEAQVRDGSSAEAKQLAQTIADTQTEEIAELRSIDLA
ncbi:lipoprotein [Kineosporia sp. NBRC 101677]|nr:lipoprotein [Kineosporia sp. NBRC 101677]